MEFKRLSDVEVVAEPTESANVLIEENGVIKKAPKTAVGGVGSEPDMVITVSEKIFNKITMDNVTITSGTHAALSEKLWAGAPVDVRVRYVATTGTYEAHATEVKANAYWYAGMILVEWTICYGSNIKMRGLVIEENGDITTVSNNKVSGTSE